MKRIPTLKYYKQAIKNIEKFAKEKGINLEAYNMSFEIDGFNCEFVWNPATHVMPHSEVVKDFYGQEKTEYWTSFQLSAHCASECHICMTSDKKLILSRLQNTRREEKIERLEKLKSETSSQGLKLFAVTMYGDKYALIKAKNLTLDNEEHDALIEGGEYNGYTVKCIQGYHQLIGIHSDMTKYIAQKRFVRLEKKRNKQLFLEF